MVSGTFSSLSSRTQMTMNCASQQAGLVMSSSGLSQEGAKTVITKTLCFFCQDNTIDMLTGRVQNPSYSKGFDDLS